ncbi:MAG: hypothetical protein BRC25_00150 [Parcubacteria group bacterium SW_6_46_9]|nr:MAG: hypothetical protein BRC25_00150 [Parcubacteria group bacterium SW_6_46_9]
MNRLPNRAVFAKFSLSIVLGTVGTIVGIFWFVLVMIIPHTAMPSLVPLGGTLFCLLVIAYNILWVRLFGFKLKDTEVEIEQGVISKSYDAVPYSRIQNVNITRTIFERILGISTVRAETAGANTGTEAVIPGVDANTAEDIRVKISEKIHNNSQT